MTTIKITTTAAMTADAASKLFAWGLGTADTVITEDTFKVRLGDLSVAALVYLANYGFGKSMQDSVSGVATGKASVEAAAKAAAEATGDEAAVTKARKPWAKFKTEAKMESADYATPADVKAVTEAVVAARQQKRFDAIVAGTLSIREGGKLTGREKWVRDTADKMIVARHKEKNATLPEGEAYTSLRAKFIAAMQDKLNADYDAYIAAMNSKADAVDAALGF